MSAETIYTDPFPARVAMQMVTGRRGPWGKGRIHQTHHRTARISLVLAAFGRRCAVCGCSKPQDLRPVHTTSSAGQLGGASAAHRAIVGHCRDARRTAFYLALAVTPGVKLACHHCVGLMRLKQHLTAFHAACCGAAPML
jgi:hypothetical protein